MRALPSGVIMVGRGGSRSGTPRTTSISRWCWSGRTTGRRFWPRHDYPRLRATARELEQRYGLVVTAPADGTAARTPQRGELEKAARQGREPARVELARAARTAALQATTPEEFVAVLRAAGYLVELRRAPSGDPLGYKLARPDDVTAAGAPVFYSGSKLAPDLSLPRLQQRWATLDAGPPGDPVDEVGDVWGAAGAVLERGRDAVAAARRGTASEDPHGVAEAAAEVFTALRAAAPRQARGGSPLVDAADRYDRAARPPRGSTVQVGPAGLGLRRLARRLVALRGPGRGDAGGSCRAGGRAGRVDRGDQRLAPGSWSAASGAPGIRRRAGSAAVAARIPRCRCRSRSRRLGKQHGGLAGGPPTRRRRLAGPGSARPSAYPAGRSDADADQAG